MAWLSSLVGNERLARKLRREAAAMKTRFSRAFWLENEDFFALALGGNKEPAANITSGLSQ